MTSLALHAGERKLHDCGLASTGLTTDPQKAMMLRQPCGIKPRFVTRMAENPATSLFLFFFDGRFSGIHLLELEGI